MKYWALYLSYEDAETEENPYAIFESKRAAELYCARANSVTGDWDPYYIREHESPNVGLTDTEIIVYTYRILVDEHGIVTTTDPIIMYHRDIMRYLFSQGGEFNIKTLKAMSGSPVIAKFNDENLYYNEYPDDIYYVFLDEDNEDLVGELVERERRKNED